jgi:DNA-binding transcriptional LysR family regulator
MEWQQLEYFRVVARFGHVTRAAQSLGISQPALSRAIGRLERELGVELFDRRGRAVQLNRFGRSFAGRVERALGEIDLGRRELAELAGLEGGVVSLGFLHTLGIQVIPELLGAFRASFPGVTFSLMQNASDTIYRHLWDGDVDLCFAPPPMREEGIVWTELFREELFLNVPASHRLAGRRTARLDEVAGDPFISLRPTYSIRQLINDLCRQAGFAPNIAFEGEEVGTVRGLVAAGLGVALLPAPARPAPADPPQIEVSVPHCERRLGLGWLRGRFYGAAARRFRDFALARFEAASALEAEAAAAGGSGDASSAG